MSRGKKLFEIRNFNVKPLEEQNFKLNDVTRLLRGR
jgi:hypothetical protein